MQLDVLPCVLEAPPQCQPALKMTANCYSLGSSRENTEGITLLLAHCIGSHKEQWEPVLQRVFQLQQRKHPSRRIREAWAFDWQNHGDAAVLNQSRLASQPEGVSISYWAKAIAAFAASPRMLGHRIVPIGHSAGAGAIVLTARELDAPPTYELAILIEPTLVRKELFYAHREERLATVDAMVSVTRNRRDTWKSRAEALSWLKKKVPWSSWDERSVELLVTYGLQEIDGGRVKLKCDRNQEAVAYADLDAYFEAVEEAKRLCRMQPVHVLWGANHRVVRPDWYRSSLEDVMSREGVHVDLPSGAGHLVVQEAPDLVASSICDSLDSISARSGSSQHYIEGLRSRL